MLCRDGVSGGRLIGRRCRVFRARWLWGMTCLLMLICWLTRTVFVRGPSDNCWVFSLRDGDCSGWPKGGLYGLETCFDGVESRGDSGAGAYCYVGCCVGDVVVECVGCVSRYSGCYCYWIGLCYGLDYVVDVG